MVSNTFAPRVSLKSNLTEKKKEIMEYFPCGAAAHKAEEKGEEDDEEENNTQ